MENQVEDKTLFREQTPETPVEAVSSFTKPEHEEVSYEKAEILPSERQELEKMPLLASLWDLGSIYNTFDIKPLTREIDLSIIETMQAKKMKDTESSYKEVLDGYLKQLKLPEEMNIYTKLEQLAKIMRVDRKLKDSLKERDELLTADLDKLSSTKIKQLLKLKGVENC